MSLFQKSEDKFNCSAVIVAAGSSTRFGSDKLFALLDGEPLPMPRPQLAHSLASVIAVPCPQRKAS